MSTSSSKLDQCRDGVNKILNLAIKKGPLALEFRDQEESDPALTFIVSKQPPPPQRSSSPGTCLFSHPVGWSAEFWENRPQPQVGNQTTEHLTNSGSSGTTSTTPANYATKFAAPKLATKFTALELATPKFAGLNQDKCLATLTYTLSALQISVGFLRKVFLLCLSLCISPRGFFPQFCQAH